MELYVFVINFRERKKERSKITKKNEIENKRKECSIFYGNKKKLFSILRIYSLFSIRKNIYASIIISVFVL